MHQHAQATKSCSHPPKKRHPNFFASCGFAISGLKLALSQEKNIWRMLALLCITLIAGVLLKISLLAWIIIFLGAALVLGAELFNTALEELVDLVSPEFSPGAKRAKDLSAAAVFLISVIVGLVGVLIFASALLGHPLL